MALWRKKIEPRISKRGSIWAYSVSAWNFQSIGGVLCFAASKNATFIANCSQTSQKHLLQGKEETDEDKKRRFFSIHWFTWSVTFQRTKNLNDHYIFAKEKPYIYFMIISS